MLATTYARQLSFVANHVVPTLDRAGVEVYVALVDLELGRMSHPAVVSALGRLARAVNARLAVL